MHNIFCQTVSLPGHILYMYTYYTLDDQPPPPSPTNQFQWINHENHDIDERYINYASCIMQLCIILVKAW